MVPIATDYGLFPSLKCAPMLAAIALLGGCYQLGPTGISAGRGLYNEVINATEDQQILNMIVRKRYNETFGMLAVASVTANMRASAEITAQFGIGPKENYAENLVPLEVGVAYEENPTISYIPLGGEAIIKQMLEPITLEQTILITRASSERAVLLRTVFRSVNGLRNPVAGQEARSPKFDRLIDLYMALWSNEKLDLVVTEESEDEYYLSLHSYAEQHSDAVREFLTILGIDADAVDGRDILLPLRFSVGKSSKDSIDLETRSILEMMRVIGNAIELPAPHVERGIVVPSKWDTPEENRFMTIRSSKFRPDNATVAVFFRDWWFYIDAFDRRSKRGFVLLRTLLGMRLEDAGLVGQSPELTIEVDD